MERGEPASHMHSGSQFGAAEDIVSRRLGCFEEYSMIRSRLGIYLNVSVTATFQRSCTRPLEASISQALNDVVSKHPVLGAVPMDAENGFVFKRLGRIDLKEAVSFHNLSAPAFALEQGRLDSEIEEQHNCGLDHQKNAPLFWRLRIHYDPNDDAHFVAAFKFHHSLMDTKGAIVFFEDLEEALCNSKSQSSSSIVTMPKGDINPALETMLDLNPSAEFLERQRSTEAPPNNLWSGAVQAMPCKTKLATIWLSASQTKALMRQCKIHGSSITALIMSIMAHSCFDALGPEVTVLQGDCAASLQRFFAEKLPLRSIGCYATSFSLMYRRNPSSIWDDAKHSKAGIDNVLLHKGSDSSFSLLQRLPNFEPWLKAKQGKKRWPAWELSNVGTIGPRSKGGDGSYAISSMLFSQSASSCSAAIKVSAMSGRDNRLSLAFSYQEGIVDVSLLQAILDNVRGWIAHIANAEDSENP